MTRLTFTALILTLVGAPAFALTPTFTKITDNTITPGDYLPANDSQSGPRVNDAGVAAFVTELPQVPLGPFLINVYSGNGGPVQNVSVGFATAEAPDINNAGTVAFQASSGGVNPNGVYIRNATVAGAGTGPLTPIATKGGKFVAVTGPRLSANGYIAFTGDRTSAGPGGNGAYRSTTAGGPIVTIAEDPDTANSAGAAAVNNAGTVVYGANGGIFTGDGINPPTDYGASGLNILQSADINNAGMVNLTTTLAVARYNGNPNSPTIIAQVPSPSPFSSLHSFSPDMFDSTGIADNGTVAFGAKLTAAAGGGAGIFVGPDILNDKIIRDGDPLFGSTLTRFFFQGGISDNGQKVAFAYELANGQMGVAVATVPEPGSAVLLVLSGLGTCLRRRHV